MCWMLLSLMAATSGERITLSRLGGQCSALLANEGGSLPLPRTADLRGSRHGSPSIRAARERGSGFGMRKEAAYLQHLDTPSGSSLTATMSLHDARSEHYYLWPVPACSFPVCCRACEAQGWPARRRPSISNAVL